MSVLDHQNINRFREYVSMQCGLGCTRASVECADCQMQLKQNGFAVHPDANVFVGSVFVIVLVEMVGNYFCEFVGWSEVVILLRALYFCP